MELQPITIYGALINCGDGSAHVRWFLTKEVAERVEDGQSEGWGESCITSIETFVGSSTYKKAVENGDGQDD